MEPWNKFSCTLFEHRQDIIEELAPILNWIDIMNGGAPIKRNIIKKYIKYIDIDKLKDLNSEWCYYDFMTTEYIEKLRNLKHKKMSKKLSTPVVKEMVKDIFKKSKMKHKQIAFDFNFEF